MKLGIDHALIQEHRSLAARIASRYYLPGADRDDAEQEALIALWEATRDYDGTSPFPPFAAVVIRRRLHDAVKAANRGKHSHLTSSVREASSEGVPCDVVDLLGTTVTEPHRVIVGREALNALRVAFRALSGLEREAFRCSVNDIPYAHDKSLDNAQQRAVKKLRRAVA